MTIIPTIDRHLVTNHTIEAVGNVTISTIDLKQSTLGILKGCETCIFWPSNEPWACGGEDSEVVDTYSTWDEAVAAHNTWTAEKAAQFMVLQRLESDGRAAGHGR